MTVEEIKKMIASLEDERDRLVEILERIEKDVPPAVPDYRAKGAVPVAKWIGQRILQVEEQS